MITVTPNTAKMYHNGVEVSSVISRIEFSGDKSGKTIYVAQNWYLTVEDYKAGLPMINSDLQGVEGFLIKGKYFDLSLGTDPETYDPQTIQVAHDKVKADLEALGYTVVISGI